MQLFRIRGSVAFVAIVAMLAVALAAGAPGWAAILVGLFLGPTISWMILSVGPLGRSADRADHWLETPKLPDHPVDPRGPGPRGRRPGL